MTNEVKPIWQSKTVWGGLVALGAGVAGIWGYTLTPEEQQQLVAFITAIASSVGGVVAIIGRLLADKKIGK